jgi:hypothetical protein
VNVNRRGEGTYKLRTSRTDPEGDYTVVTGAVITAFGGDASTSFSLRR